MAELNTLLERLIIDRDDICRESYLVRDELQDYLEDVHSNNLFQHPIAVGILEKVITDGIDTLSEKQLNSLAIELLNRQLYINECKFCGEKITWDDMNFTLNNDHCSECECREKKLIYQGL